MDRKPQPPRYPMPKNITRNYISELKIDNDSIDTIYSEFSTGEYTNIMQILSSNKILNFRNVKGETLIHAILKNPSSSLTEQNILDIIKLLVRKNVSINAMNEYNQTPVHLAAKSGYYDIIDYLIVMKADFNKIDNYGNAPVHYLIDNFIQDCKEGEYYKIANKKIKKASGEAKYEQMTEKFIVLSLIEQLEMSANKDDISILLKKIRQIVQYYKFYKIEDINKIVNEKKLSIDNLYKAPDIKQKKAEIQKILFSSVGEFNSLYKDLNFENKMLDNNINSLINDETLNDINKYVSEEKNLIKETYKTKIKELVDLINPIFTQIEELKKTIYSLTKLLYVTFYIYKIIYESNIPIEKKTRKKIVDLSCTIIKFFYTDEQMNFYDFDKLIQNSELIETEQGLEELNLSTQFIRSDDFDPIAQPPPPAPRIPEPPFTKVRLTMDEDPRLRRPYIQKYEAKDLLGIFCPYMLIDYNFILNSTRNLSNKVILTGTQCILTVLFNILNYCTKYLTTIQTMDFDSYENYPTFYLNYITEIIINISNNLSVFNNLYSKINIYEILKKFNEFCNLVFPEDPMYGLLIGQIAWFNNDDGKTGSYDLNNPVIVKMLNDMVNEPFDKVLDKLTEITSPSNINKYLNMIYEKILKMNDSNNNIVEITNKYYSFKYLESLISTIKLNPLNNSVEIKGFFSNNFFPNNSIFPSNLNSYINKYFQENIFDINALEPIKKDLFKKYYDYNFNQLYDGKNYLLYPKSFKLNKIIINSSPNANTGLMEFYYDVILDNYTVKFTKNKFTTGYDKMFYKTLIYKTGPDDSLETSIFSAIAPFNELIESTDNNVRWLQINTNDYNVYKQPVPIVSLREVNKIISLFGFKISELLNKNEYTNVILNTQTYLSNEAIPENKLNVLMESLNYLLKPENEDLLKKVVIEKIILFINSYIKIQVNQEINGLLDNITNLMLTNPLRQISDDTIVQDVKNEYSTELKKYTMQNMIPQLLKKINVGTWSALTQALISTDNTLLSKSTENKLLLNKCVNLNKIEPLKTKLKGKINFRILDRNGNTILNRLIDQYNYYGIAQVLKLDPELYTWENNRGQNSIQYVYTMLNSIDSKYSNTTMNSRILTYESDLQVWIKSQELKDEIQLNESKHMIYNIILNSIFLFNDCLWLLLLQAPNGWKYEDKIKLKSLITKYKNYSIKEKLLIKSFTDSDKDYIKSKYSVGSLNVKISQMIKDLNKEIMDLTNTNIQLEQEKKSLEVVDKAEVDTMLDSMINKNTLAIRDKKTEIRNLHSALTARSSQDPKIDGLFKTITDVKLIKSMGIDWENYNKLIRDELWNYYLPIIEIQNKKNNNPREKYMSVYNYALLNLPYEKLDDSEMKLLLDYNTLIVNNIYADYYDLEKYEDSEFNYINGYILNIIYLNVVNVISIEMYNGIIEFLANKYSSEPRIKEIVENVKNPDVMAMYDTIVELLKNAVWDKLQLKNPELEKNYQDVELKSKIQIIFGLLDNSEDLEFFDKIIKFYKGICENVSYNVQQEILNLLNDMKRRSLLFEILNLMKTKK
jgi:hypothetical protein